jgi:DNA-binding IclR family transcriptional regulator
MLALGHRAAEQADIIQVARPHLELGRADRGYGAPGVPDADGTSALYLDKIRAAAASPSPAAWASATTSTGLGKALILDMAPAGGPSDSPPIRPPAPCRWTRTCGWRACAIMPGRLCL